MNNSQLFAQMLDNLQKSNDVQTPSYINAFTYCGMYWTKLETLKHNLSQHIITAEKFNQECDKIFNTLSKNAETMSNEEKTWITKMTKIKYQKA